MARLYVIAGHGAGDPGACAHGFSEAERVRALASRMEALGGDAVEVLDTSRNWYADGGISSLSLPSGAQMVELHMDSAGSGARGGHVVINGNYAADAYDRALADFISGFFPGRSRPIVGRTDLANPNRAAARGISYRLLECCFISNYDDLQRFNSSLDAVARGILGAFGIGAGGRGWVEQGGRWWYERSDGTYPAGEWESVGGAWYLFDADGWMLTGWQEKDGEWYLLDGSGAMLTGWRQEGGLWYLLASDGRMLTGWQEVDGAWYLLNEAHDGTFGAMLAGWQEKDGEWYFLGSDGAMRSGWFRADGEWFYASEAHDGSFGAMRTGLVEVGGELYFLHEAHDGRFGAMDEGWVEAGGRRMLATEGGAIARARCAEHGGRWYAFDADGAVVHAPKTAEDGAIEF